MKILIRGIRLLGFLFLMLLASCGIGFASALLPNQREKQMDNQIKVEQVDKKEEEDSEEKPRE